MKHKEGFLNLFRKTMKENNDHRIISRSCSAWCACMSGLLGQNLETWQHLFSFCSLFHSLFPHPHLFSVFSACMTNSEEIPNSSLSNPNYPLPQSPSLTLFFGRAACVSHLIMITLPACRAYNQLWERREKTQAREGQETEIENERWGLASL